MSNKIDGYTPSTTLVTGGGRSGATQTVTTVPAPDPAAQQGAGNSGSDTTTVSSAALLLVRLGAAVDQAPAVDSAKVANLQAQISAGTYQPDSQSIAAKLLATQNEQPN